MPNGQALVCSQEAQPLRKDARTAKGPQATATKSIWIWLAGSFAVLLFAIIDGVPGWLPFWGPSKFGSFAVRPMRRCTAVCLFQRGDASDVVYFPRDLGVRNPVGPANQHVKGTHPVGNEFLFRTPSSYNRSSVWVRAPSLIGNPSSLSRPGKYHGDFGYRFPRQTLCAGISALNPS